jgi:hypothetical protein
MAKFAENTRAVENYIMNAVNRQELQEHEFSSFYKFPHDFAGSVPLSSNFSLRCSVYYTAA